MTPRITSAILLLGTGCTAQAWGEPEPLVVASGWEIVADDDPFGAPPAGWSCDPQGWGTEVFGLEDSLVVRTQLCDFVSFEQPILAPIRAGERVFVRAWHDPLTAWDTDGGAVAAHLGLSIAGQFVWGVEIPIPNAGQIVLADVELPVQAPEGARAVFHVDNHGANTYHLLEVSVRPRVGTAADVAVLPSGYVGPSPWSP